MDNEFISMDRKQKIKQIIIKYATLLALDAKIGILKAKILSYSLYIMSRLIFRVLVAKVVHLTFIYKKN